MNYIFLFENPKIVNTDQKVLYQNHFSLWLFLGSILHIHDYSRPLMGSMIETIGWPFLLVNLFYFYHISDYQWKKIEPHDYILQVFQFKFPKTSK